MGQGGPYTPERGQGQLPACSSGASVRKGTRSRVIPRGLLGLRALLFPLSFRILPPPTPTLHSALHYCHPSPGAEILLWASEPPVLTWETGKRHTQQRVITDTSVLGEDKPRVAGPPQALPGSKPGCWDPLRVTFGGACSPQVVDGSQDEPAGFLFIWGDAQHLHGGL